MPEDRDRRRRDHLRTESRRGPHRWRDRRVRYRARRRPVRSVELGRGRPGAGRAGRRGRRRGESCGRRRSLHHAEGRRTWCTTCPPASRSPGDDGGVESDGAARLRADRRRRARSARRAARRDGVAVLPPLGQPSGVRVPDRRWRRLPGRPEGRLRLGWQLRAGEPDLAESLGDRSGRRRVSGGPEPAGAIGPDDRPAPGDYREARRGERDLGAAERVRAPGGQRLAARRRRLLAGRARQPSILLVRRTRRDGRRPRPSPRSRGGAPGRAGPAPRSRPDPEHGTRSRHRGRRPGMVVDRGGMATPPQGRRGAIADRDVHHAHSVLAGLTSGSGAMVAAATMGLPERAEQGRNYDYRYAWIRDQCFVGHRRGPRREPGSPGQRGPLRRPPACTSDGPASRPPTPSTGGPVPDERRLRPARLPGRRDVVGNWVNDQFQLDAFGEALQLFAAADAQDRLDADGWRAAEIAVDAIAERWQEPDAGIWELDPPAWTQSRLACAAGLRRGRPAPASRQRGRDGRHSPTLWSPTPPGTALHPTADGNAARPTTRVDAALLLAAIRGALAPDDPRSPRHAAGRARRAHRGRLRLPLPSRRPSPRTRRGRVPPLRLPRLALRCSTRATSPGRHAGSSATGPRADRPAVHRGVRRHPAAAARQPAPGLRPRVAHRMRGTAERCRPVRRRVPSRGGSRGDANGRDDPRHGLRGP